MQLLDLARCRGTHQMRIRLLKADFGREDGPGRKLEGKGMILLYVFLTLPYLSSLALLLPISPQIFSIGLSCV